MFPKAIKWESEEYKAFVRSKPCLNCGNPSQFHHEPFKNGGMGTKCSDSQGLNLCPVCHIEGRHRQGFSWYEDNNIDPKMEIIKLLTEFLNERRGGKMSLTT